MFSILNESRLKKYILDGLRPTLSFPGSLGPRETPGKKEEVIPREITEETAQCWDCYIRLDTEKTLTRLEGMRRVSVENEITVPCVM